MQGVEFEDMVGLASYLIFVVRSLGKVLGSGIMLGDGVIQKTNEKAAWETRVEDLKWR